MRSLRLPLLRQGMIAVSVLAMVAATLAIVSSIPASAQTASQRDRVTGVTVSAGAFPSELEVSWDAHPSDPREYRVTWTPRGEPFKNWRESSWSAFTTATQVTISGLEPEETYSVRVRARFNSGRSAWSETTTAASEEPQRSNTSADASTDRAALIALYEATNGGSWTSNTNWLTEAPLDDWHGITVDEAGRVLLIRLGDNGLVGEIPPELGNLANLSQLDLDNNDLSGEIPPELGNLANLSHLDLDNNGLVGEIPPDLGNLANLSHLDLDSNDLSGEIPPELGNLANLSILWLNSNDLSGEIPPELGNLANLSNLRLHSNQLTGKIPNEFESLEDLELLYLAGNALTGCVPEFLRDVLHNDFNELGLSWCRVWSAEMTVGVDSQYSPAVTGYNRWTSSASMSAISDQSFDLDGRPNRVLVVMHAAGGLYLATSRDIADDFTLTIGEQEFIASDSSVAATVARGRWWWPVGTMGWNVGDSVDVSITLANSTTELAARPLADPAAFFMRAPASHNGADGFTLRLKFGDEMDVTAQMLQSSLIDATNGSISEVTQMTATSWEVSVIPDSDDDVTLSIQTAGSCGEQTAVCTPDGRPLRNRAEVTIAGP